MGLEGPRQEQRADLLGDDKGIYYEIFEGCGHRHIVEGVGHVQRTVGWVFDDRGREMVERHHVRDLLCVRVLEGERNTHLLEHLELCPHSPFPPSLPPHLPPFLPPHLPPLSLPPSLPPPLTSLPPSSPPSLPLPPPPPVTSTT